MQVPGIGTLYCRAGHLVYFHDDCAPWEGRALTVALTYAETEDVFDATYPSLWITLNLPPVRLPGSSVSWEGLGHMGDGDVIAGPFEAAGLRQEMLCG